MDAIGSSLGIIVIFLLAYGLPFILFVFSIFLWGYKKFKRLAMVSYIVTIILTIMWNNSDYLKKSRKYGHFTGYGN